jgi:hypothetical protein
MHSYSINVTTQDKLGAQVPASFRTFVSDVWATKAWKQAEDKLPVGSDSLPSLYIELSPRQWFLVVKGEGRSLR